MATWNELVEVTALSGSVSASAGVDFQTVLYLADDSDVHAANFIERYKVYESLSALLADAGLVGDGKLFPSNGAIVRAGQTFWGQRKNGGPLVIGRKDAGDADWGAAYNAVFAKYQDFWYVTAHTDVEYDSVTPSWADVATAISDLASAVAASKRMYFSLTGDKVAVAPASSDRHCPMFHNVWADAVSYFLEPLDVASAALISAANPDQTATTLAWQRPSGLSYADVSDTEKSTLVGNGYTMFLPIRGVGILSPGKTADGGFVDERLTLDWFEVRAEQGLVGVLAKFAALNSKVGYTNTDIGVFGSVLDGLLLRGEGIGHFAAGKSKVVLPDTDTISDTVKASRELSIEAGAEFAGAIGSIAVTFRVAV